MWSIGWSLLLGLLLPGLVSAQQVIRHALRVVLQPDQHVLQVTDRLTLPDTLSVLHDTLSVTHAESWHFALHAGLAPVVLTPGVQLVHQPQEDTGGSQPPLEHYTVKLPVGTRTFALPYQGNVHHPHPEDAWSVHDSAGMLAAEGVYLSAATYWYPRFGDELLTFTLDVQLPLAWDAVSQGERTRHERAGNATYVRWEAPEIQEGVSLVGGRFTEYSQSAGAVQAMVFLRTPDAPLAQQYLDATAQYLPMYHALLGPYPYKKFALVENVWESGYGMPSFTLLGSKVIRLPVSSSYPHEILHNWWGNGVFVDAQQGNWSEGLTAYLADHLLQEQRGSATAYRRATLQKYTDYVATHNEIPLMAFRSRHSAATAAIGYGKALMLFHMLRQQVGDEGFIRALRLFYRDNLFHRVGFEALQRAFASATGVDMQAAFQQWVTRPGAPELRLSATTVEPDGQGYRLTAIIEQTQPGPAYRLRVPLAVSLQGHAHAWQTTIVMTQQRQELTLRVPARPWRVDVDPEFDVFRRLHHEEVPPALTQLLGADKVLGVLPAAAAPEISEGYRRLAQAWSQATSQTLEIRWDRELATLPGNSAVWLFGWENRFLPEVAAALTPYAVALTQEGVRLEDTPLTRDRHAVVLAVRHPANSQRTLAWVATQNISALPGLGRKVPHYSTYSFLGFAGDEPVNVVKGQWPVLASPMSVLLAPATGSARRETPAQLAPRRALTPPP